MKYAVFKEHLNIYSKYSPVPQTFVFNIRFILIFFAAIKLMKSHPVLCSHELFMFRWFIAWLKRSRFISSFSKQREKKYDRILVLFCSEESHRILHLHCIKLATHVNKCINMVFIFSCEFILIWGHLSNKNQLLRCVIYKSVSQEHLFTVKLMLHAPTNYGNEWDKTKKHSQFIHVFQSRWFFLWRKRVQRVKVNISLGSDKTWQDCDYCVSKLMPCNPRLNACQKSALHVSNYNGTQIDLEIFCSHHTYKTQLECLDALN